MKIIATFPPNYAEINRAFNIRGKPVIFAYGDTVYNPSRVKIPPQLVAHEAVHLDRQGSDPKTWWDRYISDPQFRLEEEIPAHQAEYINLVERGISVMQACDWIATRLASPLYGGLIDFDKARTIIASAEWPRSSAAPAT